MPDLNKVTRLLQLGVELPSEEFRRNPEAVALLSELEAEDIDREKGKNPVWWLLGRLNTSGVPGALIRQATFDREKCEFLWYPGGPGPLNGKPFYVQDGIAESTENYVRFRRRLVTPQLRVFGFSIAEEYAYRNTDRVLEWVRAGIERETGMRLPVLTDRELAERRGIVQRRPAPEKGE